MEKTSLLFLLCLLSMKLVAGQDSETNIKSGHNLLGDFMPSSAKTGQKIASFSFRDIDGNSHYLRDVIEKGPAVFVFMSSTCPLAKRYTTRLQRLHGSYAKQGISLFTVFPNDDETTFGVREFARTVKYPFPTVKDTDGFLTQRLGATMTPQVFLIDTQGTLRYRGAIDDHRYENRVKKTYLKDALDSVLKGNEVRVADAKSMGCTIHRDNKAQGGRITFSGHIARIIQNNCMSCHRKGQVAPFALTNYEEARRWRTEIVEYTKARLMPPWKADSRFAKYSNDMSLSSREIELIGKWVEQGAPLGQKDQIPPAPQFSDDWAFGEPDLIVEMPEEYVIGPEGEDDYRHFVIPHEALKDRFIEAVDVRPGNRSVVHHVLAYFDKSGKARKLDARDKGPGYTRFGDVGFKPVSVLGGWAPGNFPIRAPKGSGRWLPRKGDIVLQVHYYRTGVEERDKTKIGLYFAKSPKTVPVRGGMVINRRFTVKAGDAKAEVKAKFELKDDSYLFSVTPHMHLIGKTMKVTAHLPDGKVINVVKVDDWDFNWQTTYHLSQLQWLPKGTVFKLVATFDNSKNNPNNPNPEPKDIRWGEKTTDEMCIAFLGLLRKSEYDPWLKADKKTVASDSSAAR